MSLPALFPPGGSKQELYPKRWQQVILGGIPLPGKQELTGLAIKLKEDRKEKHGSNGGNPTFTGLEAQTGAVKVTCVTQAQLDKLEEACALLLPVPGSSYAGQPVTIEAPQLVALQCVTTVVVTGGTPITRTSSAAAEMTFHLRHWLPAQAEKVEGKRVTTTPTRARRKRGGFSNAITGTGTASGTADREGKPVAPTARADFCSPNFSGPT